MLVQFGGIANPPLLKASPDFIPAKPCLAVVLSEDV